MTNKKDIRKNFRDSVFKRDNYTCRICGNGPYKALAEEQFDAHHIIDRSEMPNGGYVKENGITVCKIPRGMAWNEEKQTYDFDNLSCHEKCEQFHISEGNKWVKNMHPNNLYAIIGSSKELAIKESEKLR